MHVEKKLKELNEILNPNSILENESLSLEQEKKAKLKDEVKKQLHSNEAMNQEFLSLTLLGRLLDHIHLKSMEADEDSQESRAKSNLSDKKHHKRLHEGLRKRTKGQVNEMMLDKEGRVSKIEKIAISSWGQDGSEKAQKQAQMMQEELRKGQSDRIDSSKFRINNEKGEEIKYDEAKTALNQRASVLSKQLASNLAIKPDIKALLPEITETEKSKELLSSTIRDLLVNREIEADINKQQVSV